MSNGRSKDNIGAPGLTYIKEKKLERRLGRCIDIESYSRAMAWGQFLEQRVLDLLGLEYSLNSTETNVHPTIQCWAGSKDLFVEGEKIGDIKCYQPKNFAEYTDALLKGDLVFIKDEFPQQYWQLVSNAIINNVPKAEAITYMPFKKELEIIREMAANYQGEDAWKYRYIYEELDENLPYLPDEGFYKNLNIFTFEVPLEDIDLLTSRVLQAIDILLKD